MPFNPGKNQQTLLDLVGTAEKDQFAAEAIAPKSSNTPSIYQQAVYDFVAHGQGNAIIEAVAGSGKTTTILQSLNLIDSKMDVVFLAFNSKIAKELQNRVPGHVQAMTFNSLGHKACMKNLGNVWLDDKSPKMAKIWTAMYEQGFISEGDYKYMSSATNRLVGFAKGLGIVPADMKEKYKLVSITEDTDEVWFDLIEEHELTKNMKMPDSRLMEVNATLVKNAREALRRSILDRREIDFNDQLYVPVIFNLSFPQFDFVFVDEAQDVNLVQRIMITKCLKANGRLIAVGDPYQAIYGFRGADFNALQNISSLFNCKTLPLSICYRCAKSVIKEAQKVVPHIEYHESAIDGEVTALGDYGKVQFDAKANDMVICMANAPLVRLAYSLIGRKIPAKIVGRDIGTNLIKLIEKFKAYDLDDLENKLNAWCDKECAKLLKKDQDANTDKITDKFDAIMIFIESSGAVTITDLIRAISSLFEDEDGKRKDCVTLSTIHKAKGLEADRVYILDRWMLPKFEGAIQRAGIDQRVNLLYVGITRAKKQLLYIETPKS